METVATAGRIDVISDVICPWCYIGKRQLERAEDLLEKNKLCLLYTSPSPRD